MHSIHIQHLGAYSIVGTIVNDILNGDFTKDTTLDETVRVGHETVSSGISLRAQGLHAAQKFDTNVIIERHEGRPDIYVHPYEVVIDGLYATFYQGHEIALLQRESDVFDVFTGATFEDEVYVDVELAGNRVEREERNEFYLISGNLCLTVQEGHPRPLDDRHIDLSFVSSEWFDRLMESQAATA